MSSIEQDLKKQATLRERCDGSVQVVPARAFKMLAGLFHARTLSPRELCDHVAQPNFTFKLRECRNTIKSIDSGPHIYVPLELRGVSINVLYPTFSLKHRLCL